MLKKRRAKRISIIIPTSTVSHQEMLLGISCFLSNRRQWDVSLICNEGDCKEFRRNPGILESDGLIGNDRCASSILAAAASGVPSVVIGTSERMTDTSLPLTFIELDNRRVGAQGAKYLMELGLFESFAFVSARTDESWSRLRQEGFTAELRRQHITAFEFQETDDTARLEAFVASLPKPTAIMCAWDYLALKVINACRRMRIKVPKAASVIGVDNDEAICEFAPPTITSIALPHEKLGHAAISALAGLMRSRRHKTTCTSVATDFKIFERESTAPVAPATMMMRRAMRYIRENISRRLTASILAEAMGVSLQLLEKRFRDSLGMTLREAIIRARIEHATHLLSRTHYPVKNVIRSCGGGNARYFMTLFKRRTGMSMSAFRSRKSPDS